MKIAVAGLGYVGLSNAILLSKKHYVCATDINKEKIEMINNKKSPIVDTDIQYYLEYENLNLEVTLDQEYTYKNADYVIIATPTNYDEETNYFETKSIESVIRTVLNVNKETTIIIKSTIPLGYIEQLKVKFQYEDIVFSPEFLREGKALYDNLYPSRIIIGDKTKKAAEFGRILQQSAIKSDVPVLLTNSGEAEAIKLFANSYLALRVSFFNELDTYAELKGLDSSKIIEGISLDPRIGNHYNNPSFGYGGYCLPKDTKQLLANYSGVPQKMISAIVESNIVRKDHIANMIMSKKPRTVGFFKLAMKANSDNYRESAILGVIERIYKQNIEVLIYEPSIGSNEFSNYKIENRLEIFKNHADIIVANRLTEELSDVVDKVYTRDIFTRD